MANIRKQFNFRNGVQVDDDNLIVSSNGLVGIGTSIPTEKLDVRGNAKVVGLASISQVFTPDLTATSATISNLTLTDSIIGSGISISSGIVTASSGVVTYYGDGGRLLNLPTSQWLDVDAGLGFTSIYAQGYVGVGTDDPRFLFQVGGNTNTTVSGFERGVGISSEGHILATGIATASKFVGIGSDLTQLNASSIAYGTISNDRIPVLLNSKMPSDINVSGIVTASTFNGNLTGNVTGNVTGDVVGNVTGDVVGTATTATELTGVPDIVVGSVTANSIGSTSITSENITASADVVIGTYASVGTNLNVGGITTTGSLNVGVGGTAVVLDGNGRLGIGTAVPTSVIQIIKESSSLVEIVSETGESKISLGQLVGAGDSTGVLRFGSQDKTLELVNNDTGNINTVLHSGSAGINTGKFSWQYGQTFQDLMTLDYNGDLSVIGETNLASAGGITTTGGNLFVNGTVTADNFVGDVTIPSILSSNLNVYTGVTTVTHLNIGSNIDPAIGFGKITLEDGGTIGIGTTSPRATIDALGKTTLLGQTGINEDAIDFSTTLSVNGTVSISDRVAIGRTEPLNGGPGLEIHSANGVSGFLDLYETGVSIRSAVAPSPFINVSVVIDDKTNVGIGSTQPKAAIDLSLAGKGAESGQYAYIILPKSTSAERTGFANTESGAMIFNTDTLKFQGYTGNAWVDLH